MDIWKPTSAPLSRRTFLKGATALGVGASLAEVIAACGSSGSTTSPSQQLGPVKYHWRMASTGTPEDPGFQFAQKLTDLIHTKTNGAVQIDLFGSSQLGSENDNLKNLQNGTLQIGFITSSVANATVPETLLFSLPYVFKDPKAAQKAYNGPAKQLQERKLEALGIKVLAWQNAGIRHIGAKKAFSTPDDMRGTKIRVIQSPLFLSLFKAFNSVPTPLAPSDVYSALQQGVITAYDQPLTGIVGFKWYEVGPQITLTYHSYSVQFLGMNKDSWDALPKKIQSQVLEAADQNVKDQDQSRIDNDGKTANDLKSKGATITSPDLSPWRKAGQSIYPEFASQVGGMSVIEKLISSQ